MLFVYDAGVWLSGTDHFVIPVWWSLSPRSNLACHLEVRRQDPGHRQKNMMPALKRRSCSGPVSAAHLFIVVDRITRSRSLWVHFLYWMVIAQHAKSSQYCFNNCIKILLKAACIKVVAMKYRHLNPIRLSPNGEG